MTNVIKLFQERDIPHATGEARCTNCKHEWVAVAPVGTVWLECPECRITKGLFKFPFAPSDEMLVRTCDCGYQLFYLTPDGHMCANCGQYQRY